MHQDFNELLRTFNDEAVRYLIVGGYAVSLHAQPRYTRDLDLLIKPDPANAQALFRALAKFGAPLEGLTPKDFTEQGSFFRMGTPPLMIDILPEIAGIDFEQAWSHRILETIDPETNLQASFIAADDLIIAKLASARFQDLADVEALRIARPASRKTP